MKANRAIAPALSFAFAAVSLTGCAGERMIPSPRPAIARASAPPRSATPPPVPKETWRDAPVTPGDWSWAPGTDGSTARFAGGLFTVRCLLGRVALTRADGSATLTVRATGTDRVVAAPLDANDPLLDAIAFSRGRFAVESPGASALVLPSWPEIGRVIEDCRSAR